MVASISGIFHLGYIDGVFQKSVRVKKEIELSDILVLSVFGIIGSVIIKLFIVDYTITELVLLISSINIINYFNVVYISQEKIIKSALYIIMPSFIFILYCLMFFLGYFNIIGPNTFIGSYVLTALILILESVIFRTIRYVLKGLANNAIKYVVIGYPILISGTSIQLLLNLDKILLKRQLIPISYGTYSLASSAAFFTLNAFRSVNNVVYKRMSNDTTASIFTRKLFVLQTIISWLVCFILYISIKTINIYFVQYENVGKESVLMAFSMLPLFSISIIYFNEYRILDKMGEFSAIILLSSLLIVISLLVSDLLYYTIDEKIVIVTLVYSISSIWCIYKTKKNYSLFFGLILANFLCDITVHFLN